jgi:hypothetical protein
MTGNIVPFQVNSPVLFGYNRDTYPFHHHLVMLMALMGHAIERPEVTIYMDGTKVKFEGTQGENSPA